MPLAKDSGDTKKQEQVQVVIPQITMQSRGNYTDEEDVTSDHDLDHSRVHQKAEGPITEAVYYLPDQNKFVRIVKNED